MEVQPKGRVLLLEASLAAAKSRRLAKAGFEATWVSKELEAVALAEKEVFDVLVIDLDLTRLKGVPLIRQLRQQGSVASVIWLVAHSTNELVARAAETGVFQVLSKPTDADSLERVIAAGVERSRSLLATLRTLLRGGAPRSVPATTAKNEFGSVLESAVEDGAVVITKHDAPKAVLISVDRLDELVSKGEPDLAALTREFDAWVARMRTPTARAAAHGLFEVTPQELGEAAVAGAKKRNG